MGLGEGSFVTDGGLETDLIFHHGLDLPEFASFPLVQDAAGAAVLRGYYDEYAAIARAAGAGLLLETATWQANPDWGRLLGHDATALDRVNRAAVTLARVATDAAGVGGVAETLVSGCVGPRGDGYLAAEADPDEAAEYHAAQVRSLADGGADLVHAMTMTTAAEAIGVVRAARVVGVPVAVSFTVETDGRLPDGSTLAQAIDAVEAAAPADHYGVNCAHPTHVAAGLGAEHRITFFRPNASTLSHAELDVMEELDAGDIPALVRGTKQLRGRLPGMRVLGGCCGTDSQHVAALWGTPQDVANRP